MSLLKHFKLVLIFVHNCPVLGRYVLLILLLLVLVLLLDLIFTAQRYA